MVAHLGICTKFTTRIIVRLPSTTGSSFDRFIRGLLRCPRRELQKKKATDTDVEEVHN